MELSLQSVLLVLVLVVFPLLFKYSCKFRCFAAQAFVLTYMFIFASVSVPYSVMRPKDVRNFWVVMFFLKWLGKLCTIKYTIKGLEHVKKEEVFVIASNHQTGFDLFVMGHLWPYFGNATPVMKRQLLYTGPFGIACYLCDSFFIDRRGDPKNAKTIVEKALDYLVNKKVKLWIFPEGTRNQSGMLLPFKSGAFHMAIQAQVPILPIVISSYASFYDTRIKKFEIGGKVTVKILPPIPTKGLTTEHMEPLMESLRIQMQDTFNSLSGIKDDASTNNNGPACTLKSDK